MARILSPISSYEAAVGAISAGADEIYCGVRMPHVRYSGLGGRPRECSLRDYKELGMVVKYAHDHGVKAIVTTEFPFMSELMERVVEEHIHSCVEKDVDALIGTDIGIILKIKETGVDVPVYASTYVGSLNYETVDFLGRLGVKRVMLERHVTIEEIREIVQRSKGVEIEVFVHGAGCSNYNGKCYGCVVPARTPDIKKLPEGPAHTGPMCVLDYEIHEADDGKWEKIGNASILDAYSYCSICRLPDLVKTGVTGLKIEGRCNSPDYQAEVTKLYRELVDFLEGGQIEAFQEKLASTMRSKDMEFFCVPRRCYYSQLFHAPYKTPVAMNLSPSLRMRRGFEDEIFGSGR